MHAFIRSLAIATAVLGNAASAAPAGSIALASPGSATFEVLHSFCKKFSCGDGGLPMESLALDQSGNLYGTADGARMIKG